MSCIECGFKKILNINNYVYINHISYKHMLLMFLDVSASTSLNKQQNT